MYDKTNVTNTVHQGLTSPLGKGAKQDYVTAIDIGTTKIVALVGKKDRNGKIQILGKGTCRTPQHTVKRGVVLNIEQASKMIKDAVEQAELQSGLKFHNAFVGIAGQHIKSRKESHGKVLKEDQKEITQELLNELRNDLQNLSLEPGHEIIHIIPQHYQVNKENGVRHPLGMFGNKIVGNFNIIEGETESVKNIVKCIGRIGIKVNDLFLEPLASAEAVLTEEEKEAGIALVDIGGGTTDIAIYYEGILRHTAVIPFGGDIISSDIQKGFKILNKYAEKLKVQYGQAISDTAPKDRVVSIPGINGRKKKEVPFIALSKIIQARIDEIISFVDYELVNSGVKDQLSTGIVVTGGGSLLRQLPQFIAYKTGQDVKLASPGQNLSSDYKMVNNPKFSTAVGLLMLGFENSHKIFEIPTAAQNNAASEVNEYEAEKIEDKNSELPIEETEEDVRDIQRGVTGFLDRIRVSIQDLLTERDSDIND